MDYTLELLIQPVADVAAGKEFYDKLDRRLDVDLKGEGGFRAAHCTPT